MCTLAYNDKLAVEEALSWYLRKGEPFTGWELASEDARCDGMLKTEVSAYIREIFNSGGMPGWASTQVNPKTGPVLYFKISRSSKAYNAAVRIRREMRT